MLGVGLFVAFWVVVALTLFFIAIRGGVGGARDALYGQSRSSRRAATTLFVIIYVGFGIALPIVLLTGNHSHASAQVGGIRLTTNEKAGRELFGARCGFCHTLAASNSIGKVGPNLDVLQPTEALVLRVINNGCLQNPPSPSSPEACLGFGNMPAGVYQGQDAQDVAAFVAAVAGKE